MEIEIKKVKLSEIKLNPDNPRTISKCDMDLLVKSLTDFPEMMQMREIVVDETMTVPGGNMRTLALRKAKAKECTAKIVKGLTLEQKREFIIKDNGSMGEWNMDILANAWSDLPLADWGVKLPEDWLSPKKAKRIILTLMPKPTRLSNQLPKWVISGFWASTGLCAGTARKKRMLSGLWGHSGNVC
jgi:hypothetical protein